MSEKPESLRLVDEYSQEVKDFGYVEHSLARAKLENYLATLHAECEALRADAARYRWAKARVVGAVPMVRVQLMLRGQYVLIERDLDAAIDAAMEQTK